jgi:hypothetical protein
MSGHLLTHTPFMERLEAQHVKLPDAPGCWLWTGVLANGYGRIKRGDKRLMAHRVSYELFRGPIPSGLTLDHLCRLRCCVNPWHLESVTMRENMLRGTSPAAQSAKRLVCKIHNVPFVKRDTDRCKFCRECRNAYARAWEQRHASIRNGARRTQ